MACEARLKKLHYKVYIFIILYSNTIFYYSGKSYLVLLAVISEETALLKGKLWSFLSYPLVILVLPPCLFCLPYIPVWDIETEQKKLFLIQNKSNRSFISFFNFTFNKAVFFQASYPTNNLPFLHFI